MSNRKKGLLKNSIVFAIGNFSSKFLVFLMIPIYTHYLKPVDYGEVDLYLTTLSLLYIIVSLQSIEAAFRFVQDSDSEQNITTTISNAFFTAFTGIAVFIIGMMIVGKTINFPHTAVFILNVATHIIFSIVMQTIRGMKKTVTYAVSGIISTFIQMVCNIIFIVGFSLGAISLLWAPVVAQIVVILFILIKEKLLRYFRFSFIDKDVLKEQFRFSLPLLPNALCLWLMSSMGRILLLFNYDKTEIGLLAFTLKFPMLLSTINSVFFMAWQMSAISEVNSKDKDRFSSEIFAVFSKILLSSLMVIIPVVKIAVFTIMGRNYLTAWNYIPIFFLGVVFNSYKQFYNAGFYSAKKTSFLFYITIISAALYFLLGLPLSKYFFINGVGIAYALSELIGFIITKKRVARYVNIKFDFWQQSLLFCINLIFVLVYYVGSIWTQVFMVAIGSSLLVLINQKSIKALIKMFKNKINPTNNLYENALDREENI